MLLLGTGQKACLFVATIEKGNGLINWLIENKAMGRIGMLVVCVRARVLRRVMC